MLTVKANPRTGTIRLPASFRGFLSRGSRFIFSQSGDTIMLKQIQEKPWPAEIYHSVPPMSLKEIDRIVHLYRRKSTKGKQ
jgi:hypothetical protein